MFSTADALGNVAPMSGKSGNTRNDVGADDGWMIMIVTLGLSWYVEKDMVEMPAFSSKSTLQRYGSKRFDIEKRFERYQQKLPKLVFRHLFVPIK